MEGQLPASQGNSVKNSPVVEKLKQLCEDVETIKAERTVIESEIKNTNPNMRQVFLNANAKGSFSEAEMSTATLDGAFKSLIDQVSSFRQIDIIWIVFISITVHNPIHFHINQLTHFLSLQSKSQNLPQVWCQRCQVFLNFHP